MECSPVCVQTEQVHVSVRVWVRVCLIDCTKDPVFSLSPEDRRAEGRERGGEETGREGGGFSQITPLQSGLGVSLCGPIAVLCVGLTHSIHIHTEQMCVCLCVSVCI